MVEKVLQQLTSEIAILKREVNRLKLVESGGRWTDWTPTVTQSVSVTIDVTYCRYVIIRNTVIIRARLGVTSAGTTNNPIIIGGLPDAITSANGQNTFGGFRVTDTGTAEYVGLAVWNATTSFVGQVHSTTLTTFIGQNPNFALASGDVIGFFGMYERA